MKVAGFEWDGRNQRHIWRHRVSYGEVEEVFEGEFFCRRAKYGRYMAYGTAASGRYLFVVIDRRDDGIVRVITARDMTPGEKSAYKQRMNSI